MNLVFCSSNGHKVNEIRKLLPPRFRISTMQEVDVTDEIPEDGLSFVENALIKARYVHHKTRLDVFADDSGLEVDCLKGAPGIFSARFAGANASPSDNIQKLLKEMEGCSQRNARFICVIALIINNKEYLFEGRVEGSISEWLDGAGGFGYDPVFIPFGYHETFAALSSNLKSQISHRAIAVGKMVEMLEKL